MGENTRSEKSQTDSRPGRRDLLSHLAMGSMGAMGISNVAQGAITSEPDERTIVWTRDTYGRPKKVRTVSAERYRRIKVYSNFDIVKYKASSVPVNSFSLVQRSNDPSDLAIEMKLENNNRRNRRTAPDEINGVPVVYSEDNSKDLEPLVCDDHTYPAHDPVEGNIEVRGKDSDGSFIPPGSLAFVAWDGSEDKKVILTAAHVAVEDGYTNQGMYVLNYNTGDTFRVGTHMATSGWCSGMDAAKYSVTNELDSSTLTTYSDKVPNVSGYWTFSGLADATTGGKVETHFAGRTTCYSNGYCYTTSRCASDGSGVKYEIHVDSNLDSGDSGGAFIDNDGNFVGAVSVKHENGVSGPSGAEFLNSINASLSPPSIDPSDDSRI